MDKIKQAGMLEVWVGGVGFRMRRRSTLVMAEARGLMEVAGQIAGANSGGEATSEQVADMIRSVLKVALVEINDGGEWRDIWEWYTIGELEAFTDALFVEFQKSGLTVDPTPPSCAD